MPRSKRRLLAAGVLAGGVATGTAFAGQSPVGSTAVQIQAVRTPRPPVIDGKLSDEGWTLVEPASGFTQRDPEEGRAATERTEVRFLYDDGSLYVGARLFDSEPMRIARRLSQRDNSADADRLSIYLDPMHDRLTGAVFRVSASNVQQDSILYNDTWQDWSWDAVWESQVTVDADGWSVEMRIPLSQLRFPSAERHTWGVNIERFIWRKNESAWLRMVPKNESGMASRMADLIGIDGVQPPRTLELRPYTAGRVEFVEPSDAGDPFNDGSRISAGAGLDLKWAMNSNLVLTATINPDFGQVEVDPAVVNLSQFETFFEEKRPFFVQGAQIFGNFGFGGSNSFWGFNLTDPTVFYSRRIGRTPQLDADGDFVDSPDATTILGAAKLTGKTRGGWSLGFLDAVTGDENARVEANAVRSRVAIEPLTNYMVARMQREARRGGVGFLATAVNLQLPDARFSEALTRSAYVIGADGYFFLDAGRQWVVTGKIARSQVNGTEAAISKVQRAAQRYFQRPDAPHLTLDEARTSLHGYTKRVVLNRNSGRWTINAQYFSTSPGYESNDLGFHGDADRSGAHAVFNWRENTPRGIFRQWNAWVAKWWTWNNAREIQGNGVNSNWFATFRNYWTVGVGSGYRWRTLDDRLTRGGPIVVNPGGGFFNVQSGTDQRRRLTVQPRYSYNWNEQGGWNRTLDLPFTIKPSPRMTVSTGPNWYRARNVAQYVDTVENPSASATSGHSYVFGELEQSQLTLTTRVSMTLTPTLGVQVYAQPLLASGDYNHFKELAAPRTFRFRPNDQALADFNLDDPDFNVRSLRFNAVLRWEMKPGSTLYAVWTRLQEDDEVTGRLDAGRDARALWRANGDDVVLLKLAYWIGR